MPVIIAHCMNSPGVDGSVGEKDQFHPVSVPVVNILTISVPRNHHRTLSGGVLVHIGISKRFCKSVARPNGQILSLIHTTYKITEVFKIGTLYGTLILFLDIGIFSRVPTNLLFN